jgi:hypothetical protein
VITPSSLHEVSAANQSGGPVLHELQRLWTSRSGPKDSCPGVPNRAEIRSSRSLPAGNSCPAADSTTLTADQVYALTAFLLYINGVIAEDEVLDAQSLPKVKMPIGDAYAPLPEWKPRTPRLKGYPY